MEWEDEKNSTREAIWGRIIIIIIIIIIIKLYKINIIAKKK